MRSLLFVPADSAKKLDKAMTSGADALIIDLEDSIALDGKARARESAAAFLKETVAAAQRPYLLVRVNSLQTGLTDADLDAVVPARPDAIMLPKAEGGASVVHADAKLAVREAIAGVPDGHVKMIVLATETAAAMFRAGSYAGASARLIALTWGAEDLSAELGAERNRDAEGRFLDPYRLARVLCLAGAAAAEVPALDTVYVDFRDSEGLRRECEEARRDGFAGKIAIHPAQVPIINELFTPTLGSRRSRAGHRRSLCRKTPAPASSPSAASWSTARTSRKRSACSRAQAPLPVIRGPDPRFRAASPPHGLPDRSPAMTRIMTDRDTPFSDQRRARRGIRARPRRPCRPAPRGRSRRGAQYGRRRPPARP